MVVLLPPPPDGQSGGGAGVICVAGNPFSHVAALEISSSSSSEDGEEDEDEDGSSSHSDSSSQIVSLRQPRQRVRLLATFRLSSCPPASWAGAEDYSLATSATTVASFQRKVPKMAELDRETDLTVPPPDWRAASSHERVHASARTQQLVASVHAESDSAAMTDALASLVGSAPDISDFVASAATMKTIFGLASSSNTKVTVAVHRVDDKTLVLSGVINGKTRRGGRDAPLPRSAPAEHGGEAVPPVISCTDADAGGREGGSDDKRGKGRRRKKKRSADADRDGTQTDPSSSLYSKFMYYSASAGDLAEPEIEKDIQEGLIQEGWDGEEPEQLQAEHGSAQGDGKIFRRAVHFQFQNLNLLLGSDTVIFNRGARTPELSLRLHDMDSEIPKLTCLDYWLDNIFNQVPHTAVCYHKEGKVHGYQMVRTQDIPTWSGFAFEPKAVMETASSILHFLQTHCTKEAGTYWLCRPEGSDEIQLFCLDDADNRQRSALSQPVGLLCFKIARRLQMQDREACAAGGSCKHRQRTARLFCNAISVVDERLHPNVVALSHEGLADAMVGAEWAVPHAHAPQQDLFHGASASEPEREAEFYVDENGDLQEAKPPAGDFEDDDTARPTVGDTAQWGMSYSLADLENAESHYMEAAAVRGLAMTADEATTRPCSPLEWQFGKNGGKGDEEDSRRESLALVSRRLRCKAAKCAIAISIRLLRKGAVADALIKAVNAFERCVSGQSRAEQEVVSEAMEVWADVHVALAALTRDQVLKVRADVHDIQEQERFLSSGEFGMCDEVMRGTQQPQHPTPLSHPLSADVEDNCNHAIRCLIRSLHVCNASCRRADLTNKLASVYSQLGAHYITMGRFTRAHQHYQQGTQLFQSIGDDQSAAALTFNLGRLFAARAHAAPMSPGLTPEQLADLLKARSHVLQAHQVLEALMRTPPPYCLARAHKALKDLVPQVQEELADIDMALSVGKLHAVSGANGGSVGWAGKAGSCVVIGGARAGGGGGVGAEEDVGVEEESADRGLQRALSTYELLALPQAAAAHVHLALFMSRVEGEAALLAGGVVVSGGACAGSRVAMSSEDKAATQRAIKTWRQRSERHLEQAAALARTLGEKVRVQCIKAEFAAKRGTVGGIEAALQSLLHLPLHPHKPRPLTWSAHPHASESGAGCATAAHFGEASAGLAAATAGSLARWAPFDGGWGANAQQVGAHAGASAAAGHANGCDEDLIWLGAQKQAMDLLMLLIRLHSARKGAAQHADRCKALFRSALALSQQHSGKRFLQLLAEQHANDTDGAAVSSRPGMEEDA